MLIAECLVRLLRQDSFPRFSRNNHRKCLLRVEGRAQVARAPQLAAAFISAALLDAVKDGLELPAIEDESFVGAVKAEAKCRYVAIAGHLVLVAIGSYAIGLFHRQRYRGLVFTEMHRRS